MRVRPRWAVIAATLTLALTTGGVAISLSGPASAMCRFDLCDPEPEPEIPDPTPRRTYTGTFLNFRVLPDDCEPRMTPWNTITYDVPGSSRSELYISRDNGASYQYLATFTTSHVSYRSQGHGPFRGVSYNSANQVIDSRTANSC